MELGLAPSLLVALLSLGDLHEPKAKGQHGEHGQKQSGQNGEPS
jgi:hypothetical protein